MAGRPKGHAKTGGRKAGTHNKATVERERFGSLLEDALLAELSEPYEFEPDGKVSNFQQLVKLLVRLAVAGSPWATRFLVERLAGKAMQPVEATGADGGPVRCLVLRDSDVGDDLRGIPRA